MEPTRMRRFSLRWFSRLINFVTSSTKPDMTRIRRASPQSSPRRNTGEWVPLSVLEHAAKTNATVTVVDDAITIDYPLVCDECRRRRPHFHPVRQIMR